MQDDGDWWWDSYSYVNDKLSVYKDFYCHQPVNYLHHIGHNLNFADSTSYDSDGGLNSDITCPVSVIVSKVVVYLASLSA